jgi:ParB family chromosome partitioning protein
MQIPIADIKVRRRVRRDMGDLSALKTSMNRYGLMNPITVTAETHELIAGGRRLAAAKELGWATIAAEEVMPSDAVARLEMELEENNQRIPFTPDELLAGYAKLEKLLRLPWWQRLWQWLTGLFRRG